MKGLLLTRAIRDEIDGGGGKGHRSCLRKTIGFRNGLKRYGRTGSDIHKKRELGCGRRRIRDGTPASALRRSSATSSETSSW